MSDHRSLIARRRASPSAAALRRRRRYASSVRVARRVALAAVASALTACSLVFGDVDDLAKSAGGRDASTDQTASNEGGAPPAEAGASYASAVLADRPIAYFRFEDTSAGTVRDEVGGAPATVVSAKSTAAGVNGSGAVELDGVVGHVDLGKRFTTSGTTPITFELWFTPRAVDSQYRRILSAEIDNGASTRQGWSVSLHETIGFAAQRFVDGSAEEVRIPMSSIALSSPHHLVITYDGKTLAVYLDGELRRESAATRPLADIQQPLTIGKHSQFSATRLAGVYDEIAIYDRALEGARVAAHYDAGRPR